MDVRLQHSRYCDASLCALLEGKPLPASAPVFNRVMRGETTAAYAKSLLTLLADRGETEDELFSAWKAIRFAENILTPDITGALDTCGTGGDGSHSINLSTLSSFVMAAAGVRVLKHGNRAITSRCGSSDLLAALGFNLNQTPKQIVQSAAKLGIGYFHAPHVHPVYARFQNLRRSIGIRTLFNLLGPVLNPVAVDYQLLGTASPHLLRLYAKLLPKLGRKSALIFQGAHGMDEVTSLGISQGLLLRGKKVITWQLAPQSLGFKTGRLSELQIQSVEHAKKKSVEILKNKKTGTGRDSVILSAACGIWIAGKTATLTEGVRTATQAIESGRAWMTLNQMIDFSKL